MEAPSPQAYPVSKVLWDSLESALSAKAKDLARDIAKTLRQDEKKLIAALKEKKNDLYLVDVSDPTDQRFECEALVRHTALAHRCRKPVQYGEKYCPSHSFWSMSETLKTKPTLRRIRSTEGDIYFLDTLTQQVYNEKYERIGSNRDGNILIFEIEEI